MKRRALVLVAVLGLAGCAAITIALLITVRSDRQRIEALLFELDNESMVLDKAVDELVDEDMSVAALRPRPEAIEAELAPLLERRRRLRLATASYEERRDTLMHKIGAYRVVIDVWLGGFSAVRLK